RLLRQEAADGGFHGRARAAGHGAHGGRMMEALLGQSAARALGRMRERGFDEAQATATAVRQDEVNIAHNEASLFRSTDATKLMLVGIVDGRRAATEVTDLRDEAIGEAVDALLAAAKAAPRD